jgi:hypothetical protein
MVFKSLQNIETAFRMTRLVALACIAACALATIYVATSSQKAVERSREKIFEEYPYTAVTYARVIVTRSSNVTVRSLVTSCSLTEVNR